MRIDGLGRGHDQFRLVFAPILHIDTFHRAINRNHPFCHIHIAPFQTAYLPYPHPCVQTDKDAKVAKCEIIRKEPHQFTLVVDTQHRQMVRPPFRRKPYIPFRKREKLMFIAILGNHSEHHQHILHRLGAQPLAQLTMHELLYLTLRHRLPLPEHRQDMITQHKGISRESRPLHIQLFISAPQLCHLPEFQIIHHF